MDHIDNSSFIGLEKLRDDICLFIDFAMELRDVLEHENTVLLKYNDFVNASLIEKKLCMIKKFSAEAPDIMRIGSQERRIDKGILLILVNVLEEVRDQLDINNNHQMHLIKKRTENIEHKRKMLDFFEVETGFNANLSGRETCQ